MRNHDQHVKQIRSEEPIKTQPAARLCRDAAHQHYFYRAPSARRDWSFNPKGARKS